MYAENWESSAAALSFESCCKHSPSQGAGQLSHAGRLGITDRLGNAPHVE